MAKIRMTAAERAARKEIKNGDVPWPKRDVLSTGVNYDPISINGDGLGVVYFVGDPDGRGIKVGRSSNNQGDLERVLSHKGKWASREPTVLAIVRGRKDNETTIKTFFSMHKVDGQAETFKTEAILPYVIWLRDQHYVSTSLEEFYTQRGQMAIDSSVWLPDETKRSNRQTEPNLMTFVDDPWAILPDRQVTGDDWYTPKEIMDVIREIFGGTIDLDPATHVYANEVTQAKTIYTVAQNGLILPWHGNVWLNPPFDAWKPWVKKAIKEINAGHIRSIIFLAFTRTLTAHYFEALLSIVHGMCVKKGRITFWGHKSQSKSSPDGPVFLYWGPDVEKFSEVIKRNKGFGTVFISQNVKTLTDDDLDRIEE